MPKYLLQANYVGEGIKGLFTEGGSSRRAVVDKLFESLGGKVEAFYYALGDIDLYVIGELPDNAAVTTLVLTATSTGTVTIKTTVLMTAEEVDEAAKKTISYRAPGKEYH
jgi:uncharacterized protein with GYD domain